MYDKTVTVFNFYSSKTAGLSYWYPHILSCVDLITDHGAMLKKYGPDSSDNAALHIAYTPDGDKVTVQRSDGAAVPWLPPKAWAAQVNDDLPGSITFGPEDFFWQGEWTGGVVVDDDYRNGFYHYMNSNRDNVYKITSVGGPYTVIPHFEILGK
ncbi:MAG: hypothetical protein ACLSE4_01730 [Clostridium sp.]|jgi:hypothetical protein|nr:MAG TPA: hypothetical protein [Caudoviricetes sp.]